MLGRVWEILTEQFIAILAIGLILAVTALVFGSAGESRKRIVGTTWKIRADGAFEAETNAGTIQFRREDIQLIEACKSEKGSHAWVCVGNLQRMVWIDLQSEAQAVQFVTQMEQELSRTRF